MSQESKLLQTCRRKKLNEKYSEFVWVTLFNRRKQHIDDLSVLNSEISKEGLCILNNLTVNLVTVLLKEKFCLNQLLDPSSRTSSRQIYSESWEGICKKQKMQGL
jgi:hypothetical protein